MKHLLEPENKIKKWQKALVISGAAVLFLAFVYLAGAIFFMWHFGFNTTINGRNCSLMSTAQADQLLARKANNFEMQIVGRDDLQIVIRGSEVDLQYVPNGCLKAPLAAQNAWLWFTRLLPQTLVTVRPNYTFDSQLLATVLSEKGLFDPNNMRPPVDASAVYKDGDYVIQDSDPGSTLDQDKTTQTIEQYLSTGQETCDLDAEECYVAPSINKGDPRLAEDIAKFNKYAPFQIVYTFGDQHETLDANTAINWFKKSANGTMTLDITAVSAWVAEFATRHDTVGKARSFTTAEGDEIEVSGGSYGWQIDQVAERNAIVQAIANQSSETREPIYKQRAVYYTLPDFANTYLEVDQSTQHMWYFVDGQLKLESDVVTGYPSAKRSTPDGVFFIRLKLSPAKLRGPKLPNGDYEWESTVTYWMQVTSGGVGFHDAYWQSSFGLARWQAGYGSHGCINMPFAKAKELYSELEVGTPVIIHE